MAKNNDHKPIIFLAFANEQVGEQGYLRSLREEARRLRETLDQATQNDLCEVIIRPNVTLTEILDVFQDARYRNQIAIFHYGGHANGYSLLLESEVGTAAANAGGLAAFLGQQTGLQLIFLNGCSTQRQVEGLLAANVPAVIATSQAIDDAVATDFASRFYRGVTGGASLRTSFAEAEAAIKSAIGSGDGAARSLYYGDGSDVDQRWPWALHLKDGAEQVAGWNLPDASDSPLYGLPDLPEMYLPEQPFRSLRYFEREDAPVFFGRGYQIRELYQRITDSYSDPLILLYGQSGVGKSSLLAAGLLPRLEADHAITYLRRDRELGLPGTLAAGLQQLLPPSASSQQQGGPPAPLLLEQIDEAWYAIEQTTGRPLVIILDQMEEVYTRPNPTQPHELTDLLSALGPLWADRRRAPQGKLILSFRQEPLADIESQLKAHRLPHSKVFLQRLDKRGIIQAVAGVSHDKRLQAKYGLIVADDLAGEIAADLLQDPGSPVAPTLQILLTKLWQRATKFNPDRPHFEVALYTQLKREGILLDDFLAQQLDRLAGWQPDVVTSGLVLDLLAYHTTPQGTAEQRPATDLAQTYQHQADLMPSLVQQCQTSYLLVEPATNWADQPKTTRLAHDALAPLVRRRFDESDAPGQRARRILESRAGEEKLTPLDELDLSVVESGYTGMRAWTEAEQRLINVSRAARAKRKRNRIIRWAFSIFAVALITFAAVVAEQRRQDAVAAQALAEQQARINRARELAALAVNRLEEDPEEGILLSMTAVTTTYEINGEVTTEAEQALHQAVQASQVRYTLHGHTGAIWDMALSPDGKLLATGGLDQSVRRWNLSTDPPHEILPPLTNTTYVSAVAFSPDGHRLAVANAAGEVQICNSGEAPPLLQHIFTPHTGWITDISFSPDGQILATVGIDGWAKLLDVETGQEKEQHDFKHRLCGVEFSPDGTYVAIGGDNGVVKLWQASTDELTEYVHDNRGNEVCAIAFSPVADFLLASGGADGNAKLWQLANEQPLRTLEGHTNTIRRAVFSSDGERLVTGGFDQTAKLWDVNSGRLLSTFSGHQDLVRTLIISGDGQHIITAGDDETVRIWSTGSYHQDAGNRISFAPDGARLATTSRDGTVRVWLPSGQQIARYDDRIGTTWDSVFYPDGVRLATVSEDGIVRIRDTTSGQLITEVQLAESDLFAVAIDPVTTLLAVAGDKTVFLLNPNTGQVLASIPAHQGSITALAFHPTRNVLASGGVDGKVQIIDVNDYQITSTLEQSIQQTVQHLAFSPTGQYLAAASGYNLITVWDVETGQEVFKISGHDDLVSAVAFTSDGRYLITASADRTVKIWDISAVQIGERLDLPRLILPHPNLINGLALSPDDSLLVTVDDAGRVRFFPFVLDIEEMLKLAEMRITARP